MIKTNKKNFQSHDFTDRNNSWYWNVLVKELGSWRKAEKVVLESRKRVDPNLLVWGEYGK